MKIKEDSQEFIEGGIIFPSPKTSYNEENISIGEENKQNNTENALKHPCAPQGARRPRSIVLKRMAHARRH